MQVQLKKGLQAMLCLLAFVLAFVLGRAHMCDPNANADVSANTRKNTCELVQHKRKCIYASTRNGKFFHSLCLHFAFAFALPRFTHVFPRICILWYVNQAQETFLVAQMEKGMIVGVLNNSPHHKLHVW